MIKFNEKVDCLIVAFLFLSTIVVDSLFPVRLKKYFLQHAAENSFRTTSKNILRHAAMDVGEKELAREWAGKYTVISFSSRERCLTPKLRSRARKDAVDNTKPE